MRAPDKKKRQISDTHSVTNLPPLEPPKQVESKKKAEPQEIQPGNACSAPLHGASESVPQISDAKAYLEEALGFSLDGYSKDEDPV